MALSLARKLLKRSYHTLRELGEDALVPTHDSWRRCGSAATALPVARARCSSAYHTAELGRTLPA